MDTFEAIETRRSVRQFKTDHDISDEDIEKILHAAIMAPSAGNSQCWHFIVVRDAFLKERLAKEAGQQLFIEQAPIVIVVCADLEKSRAAYGDRGHATYALQDTAAATENMLLAARALNLGACWIGSFEEAKASDILGLPKNLRPVAMVPIGVPNEPTKRIPPRRKIDEVVDYRE